MFHWYFHSWYVVYFFNFYKINIFAEEPEQKEQQPEASREPTQAEGEGEQGKTAC